jgi:hypothetical protein
MSEEFRKCYKSLEVIEDSLKKQINTFKKNPNRQYKNELLRRRLEEVEDQKKIPL